MLIRFVIRLDVGAHVGSWLTWTLISSCFQDSGASQCTGGQLHRLAFCSQWPEGLWVITLFRKEGGNLWCELRPKLGEARVKGGWRAAGVGEARRAVIPAPGRPHTMWSFRRSSSDSSSPLPPTCKHRVTVSQGKDKELTYSQPRAHLDKGRKQRGHRSGGLLESQMSYGSFSLLVGLQAVGKAGWPDQRNWPVLNLEVLWCGGMSLVGGRMGRQFSFPFWGVGCSFLFKASFLGKQTKD